MRTYFHDTVIVGSGAAGYNCADILKGLGKSDVAVVTEGREKGTSRNAGSDKQTYYKLALSASSPDGVGEMARDLFAYGGMDGDLALAMAAGSVQSFMKLVELGVPFPKNAYGEFVGYQTDHSVKQRATSAGPLTSRYMTEALEGRALQRGLLLYDGYVCVKIYADEAGVQGVLCADLHVKEGDMAVFFACNHLVVAAGGQPGVYASHVYPAGQTGCMGVLADAGVTFSNLHHWQYGLASLSFKWNVSGSYQQALPAYISVDAAGNQREFLTEGYALPADMLKDIFLKGYQWPFDVKKRNGSSRIDLLVLEETRKGNRVYLDYRRNPKGLETGLAAAGEEACVYLQKSGALGRTPLERLEALNPAAIQLYRDHGIDLYKEPLEIGVCAQHQNGGVYVDAHWQSDIRGLYVIGEAAGTFGAYRPGGSALNAGQVGAMRCAEHIAAHPRKTVPAAPPVPPPALYADKEAPADPRGFRRRMDRYAGIIRDREQMLLLLEEVRRELQRPVGRAVGLGELQWRRERQYQLVLLCSFLYGLEQQGSVGGAVGMSGGASQPAVVGREGKLLLTRGEACRLAEPRSIPEGEQWFESVWNQSRSR